MMIINLLVILLLCVLFLFLFALVFIWIFLIVTTVQGYSMYPTLLPNDRLLVLRHWPVKWLRKNQIVVGDLRKTLANIPDPTMDDPPLFSEFVEPSPEKFIKRLIGLPGDTVKIHNSDLRTSPNDTIRLNCDVDGNLIWYVPQGYCFVRGDGLISGDSVHWGPIPIKYLSGIVLAKLPLKANVSRMPIDNTDEKAFILNHSVEQETTSSQDNEQ